MDAVEARLVHGRGELAENVRFPIRIGDVHAPDLVIAGVVLADVPEVGGVGRLEGRPVDVLGLGVAAVAVHQGVGQRRHVARLDGGDLVFHRLEGLHAPADLGEDVQRLAVCAIGHEAVVGPFPIVELDGVQVELGQAGGKRVVAVAVGIFREEAHARKARPVVRHVERGGTRIAHLAIHDEIDVDAVAAEVVGRGFPGEDDGLGFV
jgi:hypothetical protein